MLTLLTDLMVLGVDHFPSCGNVSFFYSGLRIRLRVHAPQGSRPSMTNPYRLPVLPSLRDVCQSGQDLGFYFLTFMSSLLVNVRPGVSLLSKEEKGDKSSILPKLSVVGHGSGTLILNPVVCLSTSASFHYRKGALLSRQLKVPNSSSARAWFSRYKDQWSLSCSYG